MKNDLPSRFHRPAFGSRALPLAAILCLLLAMPVKGERGPPPNPPADAGNLADLSLEDLMNLRIERVWSASKYEQKVTQAPASVTILTAQEIRQFGYRTLADILRSVRGLYVTYDRNYSNFGFRGFDRPGDFDTRVLLLVDGHRMNDNLYDSALIGTEGILDVDLIERVEVIRGPSSSIYGSNAFFGVVNVITRKGDAITGVEVAAAGGSLESRHGRVTYGRQLANDLDVVLSASGTDTAGQRRLYYPAFDTPQTNHGIVTNADGESAQNLFGRVIYHELTVTGAYSLRDKDVPTASFGTVFGDGREKTEDERIFLDLTYEHALTSDSKLLGRAYYDRYAYRANYPYDTAAPGDPAEVVLNHDFDYGEGIGAEVQWTTRFLDRHTVIFGAEYRQALHLYQSNFYNDPRTYNFLSDREGRSAGAYAQGDFVVGEKLRVNAGLRYDHADNFGGTVNPRLGLIYGPWTQTTIKLLYGQAYRAPNAYELYIESPGFSKANPALKPETIGTYELVLEQYLPKNLRLSASVYHSDIRKLISQRLDPADGLLVFQNVDRVEGTGVELELEGRYSHDLLVRVSYALQHAEDGRTGRDLNNSPRHMAKLNLSLPLYRDLLNAGLELQYLSALQTLDGLHTSGFLLANMTLLSTAVLPHLEVSLSIYNLFNKAYTYPGSTGNVEDVIPQDGRSLQAKGTYKF
jgi:outer membrane receptor protein involved in Fe transport